MEHAHGGQEALSSKMLSPTFSGKAIPERPYDQLPMKAEPQRKRYARIYKNHSCSYNDLDRTDERWTNICAISIHSQCCSMPTHCSIRMNPLFHRLKDRSNLRSGATLSSLCPHFLIMPPTSTDPSSPLFTDACHACSYLPLRTYCGTNYGTGAAFKSEALLVNRITSIS